MDEYEDRRKIYEIMWSSKAGCIGLDEKTCLDLVWRLCGLLEEEHKDIIRVQKGLFEDHLEDAKSEIPESFRRSFVKALLEMERKDALKELISTIPALLLFVPFFYLFFTETGRRILPRTPPGWVTSKWMLVVVIVMCLCCIGNIWDKASKIKNAPRRARDLENLLL